MDIVPGIKLNHDHALRERAHLEARKKYQRWLVNFEQNKLHMFKLKHKLTPNIEEYDSIDINEYYIPESKR